MILLIIFATVFTIASSFSPRLNLSTKWDIRFELDPSELRTKAGRPLPSTTFVLEGIQFDEEANYEPPQGVLRLSAREGGGGLQIDASRYKLSEDPNERKDSLWIWGLFKDPLYPFLLLELSTAEYKFGGGEEAETLPALKMFIQMKHLMKKDEKGGERSARLSPAEIKIRRTVEVKADLVGLARAEIYDEKIIGRVTIGNPRLA